jgi:hypothetical protein
MPSSTRPIGVVADSPLAFIEVDPDMLSAAAAGLVEAANGVSHTRDRTTLLRVVNG